MNQKILNGIWDYIVMTVGCFVFAVAWECFMIPNEMSSGGLVGLCSVIEYATAGGIKASLSYPVINIGLILIAIAIFGVSFGFRTIYCIAMSSLLLKLLDGVTALHAIEGNFFYVPEKLMIPIISGVFEAIGIGLILRKGGSSGGTDIIALMVNKYYPVSLSKMFLLCDFLIITSILFLPGKTFGDMMYGYVMMVTFSLIIDWVVVGNRNTIQLMVFSEHYKEIADYITKDMERGATVLHAQGWYTKNEKNVLLVLLRRNELSDLTKYIKSVDDRAFMSVSNVGGVYGEGFEEIKGGVEKPKFKKKDASKGQQNTQNN